MDYIALFKPLGFSIEVLDKEGFLNLKKLPPREDGLFSQSYSHCFYKGLNSSEISTLEDIIQRNIPHDLKALLAITNGFSLFHNSLSLRGLLRVNCPNPISQEYGTLLDRPMENGEFLDNNKEIRFAAYGYDKVDVMISTEGGKVKAVPRFQSSEKVLKTWSSLFEFLSTEINRMQQYSEPVDPLNPIPLNV